MQLNIKVRPILKQSSNYPLLNVLAISQGKKKKAKKEKEKEKIPMNRQVILSFRGGIWYAEDEL